MYLSHRLLSHLFTSIEHQQRVSCNSNLSKTTYKSITMQNDKGQGVSHATDSSVPQKLQEKVSIIAQPYLVSICNANSSIGPSERRGEDSRLRSQHWQQQGHRQGLPRHWRLQGSSGPAGRTPREDREGCAQCDPRYQGRNFQRW